MRAFLHLSPRCPVEAPYFLLGEIPIEGRIHRDVFSLFWCVWNNKGTKIHEVVKYLLANSKDNSRTWSMHIKHLAKMYDLGDLLVLLNSEPWKKETWKEFVKIKITAFHEKVLREDANCNSKMTWLNVSVTGLSGRHHPVLDGVITAQEVKKVRPAISMLAGDYYSYAVKSDQVGGGDHCRICPAPVITSATQDTRPREDMQHIQTECVGNKVTRERLLYTTIRSVISQNNTQEEIVELFNDNAVLTQLILDPCSLNLENKFRQNRKFKNFSELLILLRDFCYAVHKERLRKLKEQKT